MMKKADIQKMQDLYNQWVELLPELEKGIEQWKKAAELLEPLSQFYSSPKWRELHDSFDEELDTKGNYSILSEDALWNALAEQHQLALEWLRLSTALITKE
ncbi:hypothetical protein A6B41_09380 [Mannheimia granulomatis]|nr:DUF4298 domain-containing protein [Mannheimia granulomatis]QLB19641.1 hypothetical protein A6B41_09380 [Mannheimia granulomatis]